MSQDNYLSRKNQLMRSFDRMLALVRPLIISYLDEEHAAQFAQDAREAYSDLIPRIPYIGNSKLALTLFFSTTRYLAVYRALQKQGRTVEDAGWLIYMIAAEETKAIPTIGRRLMGYLWFSRPFTNLAKKRAIMSHRRSYPANWVADYVQGDGQSFDYGVDYLECANCKLLQAENAFEIAPYVCAVDQPVSELLGWGLTRTTTIAEGYPKCDFRFKKGGETRVVIPDALQALIESRAA